MLLMDVIRLCDAKAVEHNLPTAHLAAVVEVESNGKIFYTVNGRQQPAILFEPHLLYRRLTGAARDEAVRLKLASKVWNKNLYPKSQAGRWQQIASAIDLCKLHGLNPSIPGECTSWGVGQVLGSHWSDLGFASFDDFYGMMVSGAEGQIEIMVRFIFKNGLDDELRDGRWAAFARGYNGKAYKKNHYDTKMEAAALRYGGKAPAPDGMLRMGAKGARVRELQALLIRVGYQLKADGDFGPATKDALKAFQTAKGITVDGVYGPQTEMALQAYRQSADERIGVENVAEIKEVKEAVAGGAGGAVTIEVAKQAVESAKDEILNSGISLPIFDYLVTGLSVAAAVLAVAAIGYAAYGWLRSRSTVEV